MEYGGRGGEIIGGLGTTVGGSGVIAVLPNTGGSLRVVAITAGLSIIVGLTVLVSAIARLIVGRVFS